MWACQMHGMSKRNERIATTAKLCRKKLMAALTASGSTGSSARLDCIGIRRDATFYTGRLSPFQSVLCGRVSSRQQPGRISPVFPARSQEKNAAVNSRGTFYALDAVSFRLIGLSFHLLRGFAG